MTDSKKSFLKKDLLLVVVCFVVYFFWSFFFVDSFYFPYGPDEPNRYLVVSYISRTASLPTGWEPELIMEPWGFSYGLDIKLPYIISAGFVSIASIFSSSESVQILAARLTSVLSCTGVVAFSILISQKAFGSRPVRWVFIMAMAFLPQVVFLGSYFNLDIFSLLSVMIIIDAWLKAQEESWSIGSCIELGVGMGLCLVSYSFAYSFLVGSFLFYIISFIKNREQTTVMSFFQKGLLMLAVAFLISGWMFIRNYSIHDGDLFATNARYIQAEMYGDPQYLPSNSLKGNGYSVLYMLLHTNFIELLYRSFICVLGPMAVRGSIPMYGFYTVLFLIGAIGYFKSSNGGTASEVIPYGIGAAVLTIGICVYYSWAVDFQPQGRYIITALPVILLISTIGTEKMLKNTSVKTQLSVISIICALIAGFSIEAFVRCGFFFSCFG